MKKKKIPEAKERPKKLRFWVVLVAIVVLAVIIIGVVYQVNRPAGFHYEGWIDCMPPLEGAQAELCAQAEAAGYPYIAY